MENKKINKVILCYDNGLFFEFAVKLTNYFEKVLYFCPWKNSFPRMAEAVVGTEWVKGEKLDSFDGKNIQRIDHVFDHIDEIDLACFLDVYDGDLQVFLEDYGIPVFGSRKGEELELERWQTKQDFKKLGMDVQPIVRVVGLENLKEYLKDKENKYIKISKFRKEFETFKHYNAKLSEPIFDKLYDTLGPMKSITEFIVEDEIDAVVEEGVDAYTIDGEFPKKLIAGVEIKDCAYFCEFMNYEDLSKGNKRVNEQMKPLLEKYKYKGFISSEIRTTEDGKNYAIDPCCFSFDTEVLTNNGWKLFKDLDKEDTICTMNIDTKEIEYQSPIHYIAYHYNGKMIHLNNRKGNLDCLVTPNHEVLRYDRHGEKLFKERADSLTDRGTLPRIAKWVGKEEEYFILPEYKNIWTSGKNNSVTRTIAYPELSIKMDDFVQFMGWYLSEGSKRTNEVINISQLKSNYIDEINDLLERLPFDYKKEKGGFYVKSIQLCNYLKKFGKCDKKFVPSFIKELSPRQISIFLDAYRKGDGNINKDSLSYFTTSKQIADDLQELILKKGTYARVVESNKKGTKMKVGEGKEYTRNHNVFIVYESKESFNAWFETGARKDKYITELEYDDMVYCVEVPNHTVYVRRNGNALFSGQCRLGSPPSELYQEMYSNLGDIIDLGSQGRMVDPESRGKYGLEVIIHSYWYIESHQAVYFPEKYRDNIKLRYPLKIDGTYYCLNLFGLPEIGAIVVYGDSFEECKKQMLDIAKTVEGHGIEIKLDSIDQAYEEFNKMKKLK